MNRIVFLEEIITAAFKRKTSEFIYDKAVNQYEIRAKNGYFDLGNYSYDSAGFLHTLQKLFYLGFHIDNENIVCTISKERGTHFTTADIVRNCASYLEKHGIDMRMIKKISSKTEYESIILNIFISYLLPVCILIIYRCGNLFI